MNSSVRLANMVNEMGNALTALQWPVKTMERPHGEKVYDLKAIYKDLVSASIDCEQEAGDLHDCVNELCLKCGNYHESYAGACDAAAGRP